MITRVKCFVILFYLFDFVALYCVTITLIQVFLTQAYNIKILIKSEGFIFVIERKTA